VPTGTCAVAKRFEPTDKEPITVSFREFDKALLILVPYRATQFLQSETAVPVWAQLPFQLSQSVVKIDQAHSYPCLLPFRPTYAGTGFASAGKTPPSCKLPWSGHDQAHRKGFKHEGRPRWPLSLNVPPSPRIRAPAGEGSLPSTE
jgi:hypothetical protein